MALTDEQIEDLAIQSYEEHLGKIIEVYAIDAGIVWNEDERGELPPAMDWCGEDEDAMGSCIWLNPPLRCRVTTTDGNDIVNWNDKDFIDPYWNVEPLDDHPQLPGLRWANVSGLTVGRNGIEPPTEWRIAPGQYGFFRRMIRRITGA